MANSMTPEEERKAAAEKLEERYGYHWTLKMQFAIDLQVSLTRTEKRLEETEGLLRRYEQSLGAKCRKGYLLIDHDALTEIKEDTEAFLNPPTGSANGKSPEGE